MKKAIALLAVLVAAAACGGGGGDSDNTATPSPVETEAPETATTVAPPVVATPDGGTATLEEAVKQGLEAQQNAAPAAPAAPEGQAKAAAKAPAKRAAKAPAKRAAKAPASSATPAGGSGSGAAPSEAPAPAPSDSKTPGTAPAPLPSDGGDSPFEGKVVSKGQGFTDKTIKIGMTMPLSGAIAFVGQECAGGVDAYAKLLNSRGGIHGRKLEVISYDDAFDPAQTLGNVKRLWEEDKVAMVFAFVVDSANEYVRQKNIPFFTFGGSPGGFATKYPTIIPVGGSFLTWGQQVATALTQHMNRHPKVVAVMTDTQILNTHVTAKYIEQYWRKLGAKEVFVEPVNMSQGDCSAQVLKYKQAGVEYWDWQSFAFVFCMPAMERLGWKPPLGQGGPVASMGSLSSTIGKSMEGVVAGAPSDLPNGAPRFSGPTKAHAEFVDAVKKYHPSLAGYQMNSPALGAYFFAAKYIFGGALQGAGDLYGELSSETLLKWIYQSKNYDTGITTPIRGYTPDCKQGNNTTWWGLWQWDSADQKLTNTPISPHVDNSLFTDDPCFMTKVANEVIK